MDIREFAQQLRDTTQMAVDNEGKDFDLELAESILEYIVDTGEVNAPEICAFKKTRARITAYDYNTEAESLDLFYLVKADTVLGKVNKSKVQQGFNYLMAFYREATNGTLFRSAEVQPNEEIEEVAKLVESAKGNIQQLRIYVITDGLTDPSAVPAAVESDDGDYITEYNVWDIQRIYQQHNIRAGKEKVEIDFPTEYDTELQCLKMSETNPFVDAYMAIIPGITLAKIYKKYQQVLLEKNVRTFLQFKGKVNKGIRKTLRDEPDMFFSYNNGISTTASEIEVKNIDGTLYITRLYDWQIVNGGQTTASIAAALSDREVELDKVFVPMKVSVIRSEVDNAEAIVKAVSLYANSQTAIKNSDFSANDPFLVDLEKFSRSEWVPNGNNKNVCKWYFERTRGQYLDQLAQLSGYNEKAFKAEYPKTQKITKTDIARHETLWKQNPHTGCKAIEKCFAIFVADVKRDRPIVTANYYKHAIAKAILYNTIDAIVKSKKLGGYKATMDAYMMSAISFLSGGHLDLSYIWENQRVQQDVVDKIEEIIPVVWEHLTANNSAGQQSTASEWGKKPECWNRLKLKLDGYERFDETLMQPETNDDGSPLNNAQQSRIDEAGDVEKDYWFALANWAKERDLLTPIDRKAAYNFGMMKARNHPFKSLKQAQYALKIVAKAQELGFQG